MIKLDFSATNYYSTIYMIDECIMAWFTLGVDFFDEFYSYFRVKHMALFEC